MNIVELAREADCIDFRDDPEDPHVKQMVEFLERFAALVLEEAAVVCDNSASHCHDDGLLQLVLKSNAAAIRALKGAKE